MNNSYAHTNICYIMFRNFAITRYLEHQDNSVSFYVNIYILKISYTKKQPQIHKVIQLYFEKLTYFRRKQVLSRFCRDPLGGILSVAVTVYEIMGFTSN